jgi:hypothetical protein
MAKAAFSKMQSLHQQIGLKLQKEISKNAQFGTCLCLALKLGHFGKHIRNTFKVFKSVMEKITWVDRVKNEEV